MLDVVLLGGVVVVSAVPLARVWPIADLPAVFVIQATAALLVAFLFAFVLGHPKRAVSAAILAILGTWIVTGPRAAPPVAAAAVPSLRVLFANLHGPSGAPTLDELRAPLAEFDADVLMVAEVGPALRPAVAWNALGYPHRVDCDGQLYCETVILSRKPLTDVTYAVDPEHGGKVFGADVSVAGTPVTLALTHLLRPVPPGGVTRQRVQARFIGDQLSGQPRALLAGDFNAVPWGGLAHVLERRSGLRYVNVLGGTWPTWLPALLRLPLDNVLVGCGLHVTSIRHAAFPRSDHLAVIADVAVDDGSACDASVSGAGEAVR
ncbi:MAG: endonuclease/exonuclease/phosphatase family protein [Pseudomonadota bacterium]